MPSYFITGVSRGLGLAFLEFISSDPNNTVVGLVRNKPETEARIASLNRTNIHILQGDLDDHASLEKAASDTSDILHGRLDYLIANAAFLPTWSGYDTLSALGKEPSQLEQELISSFRTNCVGNIHLFNLFIPLILTGDAKKVITLSTGMADADFIANYNLALGAPYAISKAAMNLAVANYSAQYAKDGVLFIGISPGLVETTQLNSLTAEQLAQIGDVFAKFKAYAPHFTQAADPKDAVRDVLAVAEKASVENGDGGTFVSQLGTKQWL